MTPRCRDVHARVSAYVDGELDERAAGAIREHLRECAECRALVAAEERLVLASRGLESLEPPDKLWTAIERRLDQDRQRPSRAGRLRALWSRPVVVPAVAAAAVCVGVVMWVVRAESESDRAQLADAPAPGATDSASDCAPDCSPRTHADAVARDLERSDHRYRAALDDLRAILDEEAGDLPSAEVASARDQLAELDARVVRARARMALTSTANVSSRSEVYELYRRELHVMRDALMADDVGGEP